MATTDVAYKTARMQLMRHRGGQDDSPGVGRVALTSTGRRVLAGELDHVALNRPDRWIGGVHLHPGGPDWRYDDRFEMLVLQSVSTPLQEAPG
jgi:hypothetical protein